MKLNDQQRELVSNNIKLIHKVIHDKVHNPHQAGIFSYDDLFQIGCIGLARQLLQTRVVFFPPMLIV